MPYRFLRFPGGKSKAVTFSYDDGFAADLRMMEIFNRFGMKCTLNLNSTRLGQPGAITPEHVQQYLAQGHEAAVHGAEHLALGLLSPLEGVREVLRCREEMESMLGRIIRGMAYADSGLRKMGSCTSYETIRKYLMDLGISYARTLGQENAECMLPQDWYAWMPTAHHDSPQLDEYMDQFLAVDPESGYQARHYPRLMYIWGHSFEFENKGNWARLESICEKLGGREDIWYATNGEIRDYAAGYEALVRSADGKRTYNPNLFPIWMKYGGTVYCIQPGETLVLP